MMDASRRKLLLAGGLGALSAAGTSADAQSAPKQGPPGGGVAFGKHQIVPLPFDPKKLPCWRCSRLRP